MIQLRASGFANSYSRRQTEALREEFRETHAVKLPSFLDPGMLRFFRSRIEKTPFVSGEISPGYSFPFIRDFLSGPLSRQLVFLCEDPVLFGFVSRLAETPVTWISGGGVFRTLSKKEYSMHWHDDGPWPEGFHVATAGVSLSCALHQAPFQGGRFQIRVKNSGRLSKEIANTTPGDAILLRTSPRLEHTNTPLESPGEKVVFVCFMRCNLAVGPSCSFPPAGGRTPLPMSAPGAPSFRA